MRNFIVSNQRYTDEEVSNLNSILEVLDNLPKSQRLLIKNQSETLLSDKHIKEWFTIRLIKKTENSYILDIRLDMRKYLSCQIDFKGAYFEGI